PGPEATAAVAVKASPQVTTTMMGGLISLWSFQWLRRLPLGKARNALGKSILGNELRPAHAVFGFGGERRIAATIKIHLDNFGEAVAAHVKRLAVLQALEESELLFGHLEQFGIPLAVEGRILQEEKRCAGVHNAVGVLSKVFR